MSASAELFRGKEKTMTNRERLGNMDIADLLDLISAKSASCLLYLLTNKDYDAVVGRCDEGCKDCLNKWLNEEYKNE